MDWNREKQNKKMYVRHYANIYSTTTVCLIDLSDILPHGKKILYTLKKLKHINSDEV